MCHENAVQIVAYLKQLEKTHEIKENFLSTSLVTGKMRAVVVNWLAEVHLQFKLVQETLYITVAIVDRYDTCSLDIILYEGNNIPIIVSILKLYHHISAFIGTLPSKATL